MVSGFGITQVVLILTDTLHTQSKFQHNRGHHDVKQQLEGIFRQTCTKHPRRKPFMPKWAPQAGSGTPKWKSISVSICRNTTRIPSQGTLFCTRAPLLKDWEVHANATRQQSSTTMEALYIYKQGMCWTSGCRYVGQNSLFVLQHHSKK